VLLDDGRTSFRVWAPYARAVELVLEGTGGRSLRSLRSLPMEPEPRGYFSAEIEGAGPGTRYRYRLDPEKGGEALADPASRWQPEGVFGPSAVPPRLRAPEPAPPRDRDYEVFYELHVGTFTPEGTFDAVLPHLPRLADLGVTALELLPVAEFSGARNWGYDGVFPFATESSYGGPTGLRRLTDACHRAGLACYLDAVYNHLGPEGSVHHRFGPYTTERYSTPWGAALNFDGPGSDEVRRHFLESALWWLVDLGVDGLRLDAVHAISDLSERPFLAELGEAVEGAARATGRPLALVAESATNTLRFLRRREEGGAGCGGQWSDDLHHALHAHLTGERGGFYQDFGRLEDVATAYRRGWVFTGQPSAYRGRRHGVPFRGVAGMTPDRLVVFAQNHDLAGNRARGERLSALVPFEAAKLAAAAVLLSPFVPLLFMGEEYGDTAPFLFFTDHRSPELAEAVREGRRRDVSAFGRGEEVPDPQDPATFERSKLHTALRTAPGHRELKACYRDLLRLRREVPCLGATAGWEGVGAAADEEAGLLTLRRGDGLVALLSFAAEPRSAWLPAPAPTPVDRPHEEPIWHKLFDSTAAVWGGPGETAPAEAAAGSAIPLPPYGAVLYSLELALA
jgi:maltooligosyltrehalose trehalohydrolase